MILYDPMEISIAVKNRIVASPAFSSEIAILMRVVISTDVRTNYLSALYFFL